MPSLLFINSLVWVHFMQKWHLSKQIQTFLEGSLLLSESAKMTPNKKVYFSLILGSGCYGVYCTYTRWKKPKKKKMTPALFKGLSQDKWAEFAEVIYNLPEQLWSLHDKRKMWAWIWCWTREAITQMVGHCFTQDSSKYILIQVPVIPIQHKISKLSATKDQR